MSFTRTKEDFVCEHCGISTTGNGYTNHCPHCLWSKHVDNDPGDRAADCGALMEPIRIEGSTPRYRIVHRCEKCGTERIVDAAPEDSTDAMLEIMKRVASSK